LPTSRLFEGQTGRASIRELQGSQQLLRNVKPSRRAAGRTCQISSVAERHLHRHRRARWARTECRVPRNLNLEAGRAAYALSLLIEQRKIRRSDVALALKQRESMIRELQGRLAALEGGFEQASPPRSRLKEKGTRRRSPHSRITPAQMRARRAQGRYLGAIRQLPAAARARVKAIRAKSGLRAALAAAKRMSRRPTKRTAPAARASRRRTKKRPARSRPRRAKKNQSSPASRNETAPAVATTR
jgi:hypothetical protein